MLRRFLFALALAAVGLGAAACDGRYFQGWSSTDSTAATDGAEETAAEPEKPKDIGKPLYAAKAAPAAPSAAAGNSAMDSIVVPDCRLTVIDKEEVPALKDSAIAIIGSPLKDGEQVSPDRVWTETIDGKPVKFKRLREGDLVQVNQLLAVLDDRIARAEVSSKEAKITSAIAEHIAADKAVYEAKSRYYTQERLFREKATSQEDLRGARFTWEKTQYDELSKKEAITVAKLEAQQAKTTVELHEVRSKVNGRIKAIHKKLGESVKNMEPVFLLQDLSRLRAEGLLDVKYVGEVEKGMRVVVEPSQEVGPLRTLDGHLQEITAVAVAGNGPTPLFVSASEDGSVRVWERGSSRELRILRHEPHTAVRSVACSPPGAKQNWCLSGAADGVARLWDLSKAPAEGQTEKPVLELKEGHRGIITAVAFSPDGATCATGGDDHQICLWDTATGKLRYRFPVGHKGGITSLQFTPLTQLVSAGRDNTLRVWSLGEQGARLLVTQERRTGDVTQLEVSPDGMRVLYDQGKSLRLLSLPDRRTEGVLQNATGSSNFTTFALFAPNSDLILTAGGSEGRLQLWRSPGPKNRRGYEVRQLVFNDRSTVPSCAAFSPDGSFIVTGTQNRQVQVWPVPTQKEIEQELSGVVEMVEPSVESATGQVRIWVEISNPDIRLFPGEYVSLRIAPKQPHQQ